MTVLLCPACLEYGDDDIEHLQGCVAVALPLVDLLDARKITATTAFLVLDALDEVPLWTDFSP